MLTPAECRLAATLLHLAHFGFMLNKTPTRAELKDFLDTVGEFAFVQFILSNTRYQWRPGSSSGPQFGEWALHANLFRSLTGVAVKERNKIEKDLG